ncbi:MAG: hypothetical protein ABIP51_08340 [Bacteroidia bacterium]
MIKETHKFKVSVINTNYYYVEIKDDVEFEINDLNILIEFENKICGKRLPVLVFCAPTAATNIELIQHLSKNKNNPFSKADAFVITSLAQKILANFYLKFQHHERPVKFFTTKNEALTWLEQFY